MNNIPLSLTFDDVLLVPQCSSVKSRKDISLKTKLTKNINLNIPFVSSNMDTVTEDTMAIAMARMGGIGILHRFCSIQEQVTMVQNVKRAQNITIDEPYYIPENCNIFEAEQLMKKFNVGTLLVVSEYDNRKLAGILSKRDLRFIDNEEELVKNVATMRERNTIITAGYKPDMDKVYNLFISHKVKKIPLVDSEWNIKGLVTSKDFYNIRKYPHMNLDKDGRLIVGAAVGVKGDYLLRCKALLDNGADIIVVDVAHGHSDIAINAVRTIKKKFNCEIIAGNVVTAEGALDLKNAGADAIKVGIGPSSICSTRLVTGFGMSQLSAIMEVASINIGIPIIADGGIRGSGDVVKALAAGASSVMIGSLFAGTDESPGKIISKNGKKCKLYRGMAGTFANLSKAERCSDQSSFDDIFNTFVPEGVETTVSYQGSVFRILDQLAGGIRSGISYGGGINIEELQKKALFRQITQAGVVESNVKIK